MTSAASFKSPPPDLVFRSHFPDLAWLSELEVEEGAGRAQEDEDDAINDLEAALSGLSPSPDLHEQASSL